MDGLLLIKDGSHGIAVQLIQDGQIVVLCSIDAVILHCVVDRVLRQPVCEHHASRRIGIAPVSFVVVLVVGRSYMPALVQRSRIVAVGREVSGASDGSLAVSYLDQCDLIVDDRIIQCEIHEVSERISRMVKLGDCLRVLIERIIVCLQHRVIVTFSVRLCVSVFKSFGIECIDMSRSSAGPGHLESVDSDKISFLSRDISRALTSLSPGSVHFLCIFISEMGRSRTRQSALSLEGVGVVCQSQEVKVLHICRMLERLLHCARPVGKVCVGMELSEIQAIIFDLHRRLVCKCIDLPGLCLRIAALRDICQRLHHDRLILLRRRCDLQRL